MESQNQNRVRMNFGMNTKGFVQMDITVEFETVESCGIEGRKAIDEYKSICAEKGLKLADAS